MFAVSECINTFLTPFITAQIIASVTTEGITEANMGKFYLLLSLFLVRNLTSWATHGPARIFEQLNAFRARTNYRSYLMRGVMNLPLSWHHNHHTGDTTDRVNKGTDGLYGFAEDSFLSIKSLFKVLGCFVMIVYLSHKAAYIVVAITLVSAWITIRFDKVIMPQYQTLNRNENEINERIIDAAENISTIIILRAEKLVFETIMTVLRKPYELFRNSAILNEWKWFLTSFLCDLLIVVVMIIYLRDHIGAGPGILSGSVYLLLSYLEKMGELYFQFTSNYSSIVRQKYRVMNAEELAKDFRSESLENHVLPENWQKLSIRKLTFSYTGEEGKQLHLDSVDLDILRGKRIAFVGARGSGKTTCLLVIGGLFEAQAEIYSDDVFVPEGFAGIKRAFSLVPQMPQIFGTRDATIEYNMTIGVPYEKELVEHTIDTVAFRDVLEKLPRGLASTVQEQGVNLSGGERQGLALIRGLLACRDKDVILLDEPTSSFDPVVEREVYGNIFREFSDKTIISSVHKLHLLPYFDQIYVFSDGKVVASGTLAQLLITSPQFQKMWQAGTSEPD